MLLVQILKNSFSLKGEGGEMLAQIRGEEINPRRIREEMERGKLIVLGEPNGKRTTYVAYDVSDEKFYVETLQGELVPLDINLGHGIAYIIFLDMDDAVSIIRGLTEKVDGFTEASKEFIGSLNVWRRKVNIE